MLMLLAGTPVPKPAGISQEDADRQTEAAVSKVQAEADESVSDLLVCLGQEERKVEVLRERLDQMGVDVESILEGAGVDEAVS